MDKTTKSNIIIVLVALVIVIAALGWFWWTCLHHSKSFSGDDIDIKSLELTFSENNSGVFEGHFENNRIITDTYYDDVTVNMLNKTEIIIPCLALFDETSENNHHELYVRIGPLNDTINIYIRYSGWIDMKWWGYNPEVTELIYGTPYFGGDFYSMGTAIGIDDFNGERGYYFEFILEKAENKTIKDCVITIQVQAITYYPMEKIRPNFYHIWVET